MFVQITVDKLLTLLFRKGMYIAGRTARTIQFVMPQLQHTNEDVMSYIRDVAKPLKSSGALRGGSP